MSLLVSTCRMDRSGRIHEHILLRELGWEPGDRVDIDTIHGMISTPPHPPASTPSPSRRDQAPRHPPAPLQHQLLPTTRTRRSTTQQVMVVHPATVVADMPASRYTRLVRSEQSADAVGPELEEETS